MVRVRCLVSALALAIIACGSPSERKLVDTIPNNVPMPSYSGTPDTSAQDAGALVKVPLGTSPVRGPSDAWVTMIEFGDFECPACGYEEPILQALLQEYSNDLRLVFKHFPLTDIHPYAQGAAIAAECAGAQGAFWKMHDLLFLNQDALAPDKLPTYAVQAGINATTFEQCLSTQPPRDTVAADVALGDSIRARGTPTFVINGLLIFGDFTRPQLKTMINPARAQAEASGVPRSEYYDTVILSP
jgi:protein-disulfide isomerase